MLTQSEILFVQPKSGWLTRIPKDGIASVGSLASLGHNMHLDCWCLGYTSSAEIVTQPESFMLPDSGCLTKIPIAGVGSLVLFCLKMCQGCWCLGHNTSSAEMVTQSESFVVSDWRASRSQWTEGLTGRFVSYISWEMCGRKTILFHKALWKYSINWRTSCRWSERMLSLSRIVRSDDEATSCGEDPELKAQREKERRQANNARER